MPMPGEGERQAQAQQALNPQKALNPKGQTLKP